MMQKLSVNLENCFGIGKLNHEFDFSKSNSSLIYAPNGTMKTSFARTFDLLSKNDPKNIPRDRVYKSRVSKYEVTVDNVEIDSSSILVINSEDNSFDGSNKISSFLAKKELKQKYDQIYKDLDERKNQFIRKLKLISQSSDCEKEILNTFSDISQTSLFEILSTIKDEIKTDYIKISFKYNDVFDSKGKVLSFLEKNKTILDQYISNYKSVVSKSSFFKENSSGTFGTYQANEIIKSISDNAFFYAGHTFVLEDKTVINDSIALKKIVDSELENILQDEKLKVAFEKVDKAISNNIELRNFQKVIEKDNLILVDLENYHDFKKKVWISFLSEIKTDADLLIELYLDKKKDLEVIIQEAKKDSDIWDRIIDTFNSRFFVPFKVVLSNKEDIILKKDTATLDFLYADRNDEPVNQDKNSLIDILSKGEQRAYFILQFLFELEARKANNSSNLLVLDDISDSFDYKNKFAIIEYISDLIELDNFRIIILTHNFDFYRTVASRLNLHRSAIYMATKNDHKEIFLQNGQYFGSVFSHLVEKFQEPKTFISLIAFVRNLIEYSEIQNSPDFLTLTSCLHLKDDSNNLTSSDIFEVFSRKIAFLNGKNITFGDERILDLIYRTASNIAQDPNVNEILLQNKISLAIAIRLKAENYLISKLPNLDLQKIKSNQTSGLCREYIRLYPTCEHLTLISKINLMTPENIHINAFMYEPLIDMSLHHLIKLYEEVCLLNQLNPLPLGQANASIAV